MGLNTGFIKIRAVGVNKVTRTYRVVPLRISAINGGVFGCMLLLRFAILGYMRRLNLLASR